MREQGENQNQPSVDNARPDNENSNSGSNADPGKLPGYTWSKTPESIRTLFSPASDPETNKAFMTEAIAEARSSGVRPAVGAVVVKDGQIIARGHRRSKRLREEPPLWRITHAEQAALANATENIAGATLYVTLEPCAGRFHGPTIENAEVCSALVPRAGIKRVVVGLVDEDPMTFGKGLISLRNAGVELEWGGQGLEDELLELIGNGDFGVQRPKPWAALVRWLKRWL